MPLSIVPHKTIYLRPPLFEAKTGLPKLFPVDALHTSSRDSLLESSSPVQEACSAEISGAMATFGLIDNLYLSLLNTPALVPAPPLPASGRTCSPSTHSPCSIHKLTVMSRTGWYGSRLSYQRSPWCHIESLQWSRFQPLCTATCCHQGPAEVDTSSINGCT